MINLRSIIDRINALLAEDTEASVTYAALEARLAIEKVVYDRLRQRHDYISHDQLKRWQPGAVVNTLLEEVDANVTLTSKLSMAKTPVKEGVRPEDEEYVELGTEIGFNPKRITKMWNALARLALHVRLPEHRDDHISAYGDKAQIRAKVAEVVEELERLAKGTIVTSGYGPEVSFECDCGETNKRRAELLRDGQHVHCINPECEETWKAIKKDGDDIEFERVTIPIECAGCKVRLDIPWRWLITMKPDQMANIGCHACGHRNHVKWQLAQAKPPTGEAEARPI
ncbi:hypothetical protein SZ64_05905 [Erythrobacter sp. SG61-1L]|uniref:hypothetical protein n=1 Tax=Erythrobacter sp. SG61-1L TaxID=1603897 RepID=UPI0006C91868|nr:hypothetical protein [Erythrobacter sp. SG61-1L]KPL67692.1 hypothetical protein SZ64_05905 [Erythrobacter sp. SG61-1L]